MRLRAAAERVAGSVIWQCPPSTRRADDRPVLAMKSLELGLMLLLGLRVLTGYCISNKSFDG
jgi:hypothetical protein